jgi:hypothetical protein
MPTLDAYRDTHRPIGEGEQRVVREVFDRILEEMKDADSTGTMFQPFATIVNFVLANRKIRDQRTNVPLEETNG